MLIFFKDRRGKSYSVDGFEPGDTIEQVMWRISALHDYPNCIYRMAMIFAGKDLERDRTLSDYNIKRESTLHVVDRPRKTSTIKFELKGQIVCYTKPYIA